MPLPNLMPSSVDIKIQALEARVAALEKALQVSAQQVVLQIGTAKITLNPGGEVQILGNSVKLVSTGEIQIKAAGHLIMKGANIT